MMDNRNEKLQKGLLEKHPYRGLQVYKYRAWNDFTEDLLKYGKITFSEPSGLNDPLEAKLIIKSEDEMLQDDLKVYMKAFLREDVRILSLSSTCRSMPMWAHYADDHKGICVEFELSPYGMNSYMNFLYKDEYSLNLPVYSVLYQPQESRVINYEDWIKMNDAEQSSILYLSKTDEWSYEKECRLFLFNRASEIIDGIGRDVRRVSTGSIKSIIFGLNTPDYIKNRIVQMTKEEEYACYAALTYQIRLSDESFTLRKELYPNVGQEWKSMSPAEIKKRGIRIEP